MGSRRIVRIPALPGQQSLLAVDTASLSEASFLQVSSSKPGPANTGLALSTTSIQSSNISYGSAGAFLSRIDYQCRVSVTAANITFENCIFRGDNSANAIVTASNVNASNIEFINCEWAPQFPRYETNGFAGHDAAFFACNMHHTTDLVQISNQTKFNNEGPGWPTGMGFYHSWLHDFGWWTAATGGVVHPSDTETHNDLIQQFGGDGTEIWDCLLQAQFARQYGHWRVTNPNSEPYQTVTLGSLPDGGPFQAIPNRGTGTLANGRYNWDDCAGLMINATQGPSTGFSMLRNWCEGGNYFTNGGGNPWSTGLHLGTFQNNRFSRDCGDQPALGGNNGHTLDFGGTWSGHVTVSGNVYDDDDTPVQVRA